MTAIAETHLLGGPMQPITLCQYDVDCAPVVDCRDAGACAAWSILPAELDCPDWRSRMLSGADVPSQDLAERLADAGLTGMIVRSYAVRAVADSANLVLWTWSDTPPAQVQVADSGGRLPKDRRSWT